MGSANFKSGTIWTADNLSIMRGMNTESVDLIYLDPPFNSNADYAAPIGSQAAGAEFKDTWSLSDIDVEWINLLIDKHPDLHRFLLVVPKQSDKSYLVYMATRILELHRILKPTGSIYLHCDPTMSHYLKILMDLIFGRGNFRNEIIWAYTGPSGAKRQFPRKHDVILFYSKTDTWNFYPDAVRVDYKKLNTQAGGGIGGTLDKDSISEYLGKGKIPESWWADISPVGRLAKERIKYPTQKPLKLLERIIRASSKKDDIVFDPFCGCATTLVAAHHLSRRWVGIDISPKAVELVVQRMSHEQRLFSDYIARTDIPKRTDLGKLPPPKSHKETLYGIQGGDCAGCATHFEARNMEVDHIISVSKGGTDHIENLQLLCGNCNRIKGDRGMDYLLSRLGIHLPPAPSK